MNKALPVITESPQDLQRRMRRRARGPQAPTFTSALSAGQWPSHVARRAGRLLAVHRHTIGAWLRQYEAGGLPALLTIKKAPGKRSALTPAVLAPPPTTAAQPQGFTSYGEIQRYLARRTRCTSATAPSTGWFAISWAPSPKRRGGRIPKKRCRGRPVSPDPSPAAPVLGAPGPPRRLHPVSSVGAR